MAYADRIHLPSNDTHPNIFWSVLYSQYVYSILVLARKDPPETIHPALPKSAISFKLHRIKKTELSKKSFKKYMSCQEGCNVLKYGG